MNVGFAIFTVLEFGIFFSIGLLFREQAPSHISLLGISLASLVGTLLCTLLGSIMYFIGDSK